MALKFQGYDNPFQGQVIEQNQWNELNKTLQGIGTDATQRSQFNREQAIRDAEEARKKFLHDRTYNPTPVAEPSEPGHRDYTQIFGEFNQQPQNPLSINPSVYQTQTIQNPSGGSILSQPAMDLVSLHKQQYPHLDPSTSMIPPGMSRADYAEQQGYQKNAADINKTNMEAYEKQQQGNLYSKKDPNEELKIRTGEKESQQQDKLEQNARQMVANLRGDKSLSRAEEQRDAAIVAYNRISEIEAKGEVLNPIDYTDVLGQIYKARTGQAPGEQTLNEIRQDTASGKGNKWYTWLTGKQSPATTQDIMSSLKDMAASMGQQADKFHEGYMKTHLIKPSGLDDARWQPILNTGRGMSFSEATGYGNKDTNPGKTIKVGKYIVRPH